MPVDLIQRSSNRAAEREFLATVDDTDPGQPMQRQIQLLRQLVLDSQYAVEEATVADAIIARATACRAVIGTAFRNDLRSPQVRSFRPSRQVRSFQPCNAKNSEDSLITTVLWRRA